MQANQRTILINLIRSLQQVSSCYAAAAGDILPANAGEIFISIFIMCVGLVFFGLLLGAIATSLQVTVPEQYLRGHEVICICNLLLRPVHRQLLHCPLPICLAADCLFFIGQVVCILYGRWQPGTFVIQWSRANV